MKTLLVMRHAKSSWAEEGMSDHARPLNDRGQRAAPRMGRLLKDEQLYPDVIVASDAERARATADAVADVLGLRDRIRLASELYLAPPGRYVRTLAELEDSVRVALVIGHNPGLEELVFALTAQQVRLPTAAIAQLSLELSGWAELALRQGAQLTQVWRPKELD